MRGVRILCLPVNAASERPITIDAIINDKDEICGEYPLFGLWGRADQSNGEIFPLILREDSVIDYGATFDPLTERYFDFDLRDGKITINRLLSYKSKDRSIVVNYLIDAIVPLPIGDSKVSKTAGRDS